MQDDKLELGTIEAVCAEIGGDRPINRATYYRGVKAGIYPAPVHPTPGISRVVMPKLREAIRRQIEGE